ncbi:MAG TPA: Rv2993c-like domain-containing protein [Propionibacteriaceae bacterium]|nr:Rv2993c-like domain-containing protein [Propionibacteriaceae bacterium]
MRIARLDTTEGPQYAVWTREAWAVVEDAYADPLVRTGVTVPAADGRPLACGEPQVLVSFAHHKTNNDHPLIQAWPKSIRTPSWP